MLNVLTNIYDKLKFYFILLTQEKNTQDLKYKHTFNTIKHTCFFTRENKSLTDNNKMYGPSDVIFHLHRGKLLSRLRWQGLMLAYPMASHIHILIMILLASINLNLPRFPPLHGC